MLVSKLDRQASAPSTSMEASTATTVPTSTAATTMASSLASVVSKSTIAKTKMNCCSRTKLLNRLGYFQPPGINNKGMASKALASSPSSSSSSSATPSSVSLLGSVQPLQTPLNDCFSCRRKNHNHNHHRNNKNSIRTNHDRRTKSQGQHQHQQQESRRIRFHDTVMVMSIPSRHQYSNRIKCVLWSGRDELHEMSRRNVVEFQAEGWDWRTVVEDEDMYIDVQTGQKLHPCHIQQYHCEQQQQQQHRQNNDEEEKEEDDDDYSSDEDGDDRYFQPLKRQESSAFAA